MKFTINIKNTKKEETYLSFFIDEEENTATINYIIVEDKLRGKGIATDMLWYFYDYILSNFPLIKKVYWDDCSDKSRQIDNIYLKIGSNYVREFGPEMVWNLYKDNVKKLRGKYRSKYRRKMKLE